MDVIRCAFKHYLAIFHTFYLILQKKYREGLKDQYKWQSAEATNTPTAVKAKEVTDLCSNVRKRPVIATFLSKLSFFKATFFEVYRTRRVITQHKF